MVGHIVFNGMNINNIIEEIDVSKERDYSDSPYVGSSGSTTSYVSEYARVITCSSLCMHYEESAHGNPHRIDDYKQLAETYKNKTAVLTSESNLDLKGNYMITKFNVTEDTMGNFTIDWEFKEVVPFNVTKQTFKVWGKSSVASTGASKKTTTTKTSTSGPSSNTKYLLKSCPLMSKGSKSKSCVKRLQKFLQAGGFYKGYKVDGVYSTYTFKAVKQAQKKRKLKQTGNWDKTTRAYYQKLYKYP